MVEIPNNSSMCMGDILHLNSVHSLTALHAHEFGQLHLKIVEIFSRTTNPHIQMWTSFGY